ncbi:RNA-directed DNA polymerase, eukaryota [Tanacetum coccineum]
MGTRRSNEDDWTEVTRKNRGYRTKEDDLVKVHSNADLTRTISKSIFVTNFPDNTTSADLWNICQTYGVVTNVERLAHLCTLWIGRMHLHANVVRFERTPFQQSQPPPPTRPGKIAPSFVSAVKGILPTPVLSPPAMVLDDSSKVFSIQKLLSKCGLWDMCELPSANSKSKVLGQFLELATARDECFAAKRGRVYPIGERFKRKPTHQTNVEEESDIEAVSETFFGDQADDLNEVVDSAQQSIPKENSYDPFNIYDILNKENKDVNAVTTNSSIPFPPGFTPDKPDTDVDELVAQKDKFQPDVKSVGSSSHTVESANNVDDQFSTGSIENIQKKKESGSILEILEEMISVGQTMGFLMEGSIKDMERIIDLKGADDLETKAENVSDMEIKSIWAVYLERHLSDQSADPSSVSLKHRIMGLTRFVVHSWLDSKARRNDYSDWNSIYLNDNLLKQYPDIHSSGNAGFGAFLLAINRCGQVISLLYTGSNTSYSFCLPILPLWSSIVLKNVTPFKISRGYGPNLSIVKSELWCFPNMGDLVLDLKGDVLFCAKDVRMLLDDMLLPNSDVPPPPRLDGLSRSHKVNVFGVKITYGSTSYSG